MPTVLILESFNQDRIALTSSCLSTQLSSFGGVVIRLVEVVTFGLSNFGGYSVVKITFFREYVYLQKTADFPPLSLLHSRLQNL